MKFAFKFKLPKWERPKPEVPYVSNPIISELETVNFTDLTAERRRDVLLRIKHATEAIAADRRRNPAILTDRIRLQRMWVEYFKINQTVPAGDDVGAGLSFSHEETTDSLAHTHRAPGALMTTQEELLAQASFKIDMGDMVMDDLDDFDTPPPRLPPRPMPGAAASHHEQAAGPVHVVTHPETGDSLHIAGLHDLVIAPPEESVAALSSLPSAQPAKQKEDVQPPAQSAAADEEPRLDAQAQADLVARMRALAQSEAVAVGPEHAAETLSDNPMIARMRALAAAKAAQAETAPHDENAPHDEAVPAEPETLTIVEAEAEPEPVLVLDLPEPSAAVEPEPAPAPAASEDQEPPRLSPEEQIRLAEEMRARIKSETTATPAAAEDPMVARMRKQAQSKPKQPDAPAPALTISIPEEPVVIEPSPRVEQSFEDIKNEIVAQTLQQAQSEHLQSLAAPEPEKIESSAAQPVEAGMLDRLRRLAGIGGKKPDAEPESAPVPDPAQASEPVAHKGAKAETIAPEPAPAPVPPPAPAAPPAPAPDPLPLFSVTEPEPAPVAEPEQAPPAPRPREREASATPSTRDWVNVKLLRPTVIRGLPLPDQVITIVPYPDAKRLEENGSVQILTKPRSPRS